MNRLLRLAPLLCLLVVSPGLTGQETPDTQTTSPEATAPQPIPVGRISERVLVTDTMLRTASSEGEVEEELRTLEEDFAARKEQMDTLQEETLRRFQIEGPVSILEEASKEWARVQEQLQGRLNTLSSRADSLGAVLEKLHAEREVWELTRDSPAAGELPPALRREIRNTLASINKVERQVRSARDSILNLQVRIGYEMARADEMVAEQQKEIANRRQGLLEIDSVPLWGIFGQSDSQGDFSQQSAATWEMNQRWIRRYVAEQRTGLIEYGLLLAVLVVVLVFLRRKVRIWAREDTGLLPTLNLLERPVAASVVITVLLFEVMNPAAPNALIALLGLFLLLALLRMLPQLSFETDRSWPYLLGLLFLLQQTVKLTPDGYMINRLALALLSLTGVGVSLWLARPWRGISESWVRAIRLGALTAAVLFGLGAIANLVGSVGLAMVVITGTLYAIFAVIVFLLATVLLRAFVVGGMLLPAVRHFGIFSQRSETTRRTLFRIITILAIIGWVISFLRGFLLLDPVIAALNRVLEAKISFGQFSLTLESVLTFVLVIWVSFKISQLLCFLLDTDVLPHMRLARGIPKTVTRLTHYAVIVIGVIIGITAAGFPLDRVTIIFGAVGVGIGFGLQNVVNNFVSGLILLFERPVKIGDKIQLAAMEGIVHDMGIRASIVRTYQGASVIVPNANLISAEVVNWTHRDDRRRLDIPVGVAYGTEPQKVIDLLVEVAAEHPEISNDPKPAALFLNFGESSLDFELRAWTVSDQFLRVSSELRVALTGALKEEGIEIPFPQRDLHLRSVDEGVSLAVARTGEDTNTSNSPKGKL